MPVEYLLVPPGTTAKTLITEFARYLGIPTTTRITQRPFPATPHYLHQRTAGRIESLTSRTGLIQAAITAIHDGIEHINKISLKGIRLDHHAETHHRPTRTR
ncbi:hypothetical protein [Streptomyces sp. NPDC003710]